MKILIKKIIREEIDDLSWMDEISAHRYPVGSTIKPIDGYYFWYRNSFKKDLQRAGDKIHGYGYGIVTDILDDKYYKVQIFGKWSGTPLETEYYLLISDLDGLNESDDFGWADDIEPSMRDKQDFKRSNTLRTQKTTTRFGNDTKVGDKFLPPNSANVWEVVSMVYRYQQRGLGLEVYSTRLETEDGKKKHVWWEKPIRHTQPNGTFPRRSRPWRKIVEPMTEGDESISEP